MLDLATSIKIRAKIDEKSHVFGDLDSMCCAQTAAPKGKKAEHWSMRLRGYCPNKNIMCRSAGIVSRLPCLIFKLYSMCQVVGPATDSRTIAAIVECGFDQNDKRKGQRKGYSRPYNTWIQLSRLQRIHRFQYLKLRRHRDSRPRP